MERLEGLRINQLKHIVATHNAIQKETVIKNYGKMTKSELIKTIREQIKEEHLAKYLEAIKLIKIERKNNYDVRSKDILEKYKKVQVKETTPVAEKMKIKVKKNTPAVGQTVKIKVKKNRPSDQEGTLDTNLVKEMLMMMEDAGSKTAEKIRKSAMVDEMTAKQENAIVEDFIKMMETGGMKASENVKKNVGVKPPKGSEEEKDLGTRYYEKVVNLNSSKKNKKFLELLVKPVFGEKRHMFSVIDMLNKKLDYLGYVNGRDSWNSNKYKKGVYLIEENIQTSEYFIRKLLEIYYDEERTDVKGSLRGRELNKQLKDIMSGIVSKSDIRFLFSKISVEAQQKLYKEFSRYMLKVPNEYTDEEKDDMLNFYMKEIVRPKDD